MEAKGFSLAILGDAKVGKTTLCQNITDKPFNDRYAPTNGCEYYQKIYEDSKNNQMMKIDIYCASGDQKSQKLSKFLYKDAICIITDRRSLDICLVKEVYPYIAEKHRVKSLYKIEHSIRNALDAAYKKCRSTYPERDCLLNSFDEKPTNKKFLLLAVQEVGNRLLKEISA